MNQKPIQHLYTLLCDDVRLEDNGKAIIIGLYNKDILVPQFPFTFPQICFYVVLDAEQPGQYMVKGRLTHQGIGQKILNEFSGVINVQAGRGIATLRLGNLVVEESGTYVFELTYGDNQEQLVKHDFQILLRPRR